jgi:hypothetical protein
LKIDVNPLLSIPQKKIEEVVDPVARSIAKPDAFAKPATIGKPGQATNHKPTRIRTMDWKRTRGRPRKKAFDKRAVKFF